MARNQTKLAWMTNNRVYQHAKNLRELVLLAIFWLTIVGSPFGKPTLEVRYRLDRLYPPIGPERPSDANNANAVKDSNEVDRLLALMNSRDLLRLTIRNNSSTVIEDVDLQIDAYVIADVALHSNSSRIMANRRKLTAFEISDNFIAKFPNLTSIPAKARVEMLIWGDINTFVWRDPVQVLSSARSTEVAEQGMASGFGLFIARNVFVLTIFLGVGLLLLGLRRYARSPSA